MIADPVPFLSLLMLLLCFQDSSFGLLNVCCCVSRVVFSSLLGVLRFWRFAFVLGFGFVGLGDLQVKGVCSCILGSLRPVGFLAGFIVFLALFLAC